MYLLPDLPYNYNALEPYIDEQTMRIHHDGHHRAYVDKLNAALQSHDELTQKDIKELLKDLNSIPEDVRTAVKNNGGGHLNHSFFWELLKKNNGQLPLSEVSEAINRSFGNFDSFKEKFSAAAVGQFGSGWAWLLVNNGNLEIISTPNQDAPVFMGKNPILGIDVWEHAYYLKYQNRRPEYVEAFFNVINWDKVNENYLSLIAGEEK